MYIRISKDNSTEISSPKDIRRIKFQNLHSDNFLRLSEKSIRKVKPTAWAGKNYDRVYKVSTDAVNANQSYLFCSKCRIAWEEEKLMGENGEILSFEILPHFCVECGNKLHS